MSHQKGKSYLVSAHYLKGYSFQAKQSCSKYVVTTISESTVKPLIAVLLLNYP